MKNSKKNTVLIICCVLAIALFLASLISICVFETRAKGVPQSDITVYVDGVEFSQLGEVPRLSSYEVTIDAKDGIDYYIHLDAQYGYVVDNKTVVLNSEQTSSTRIPLRVTLIKENYSVREYVYYLMLGSI